jgi:type 1 glutamine amidotransferase
MKTSSTLVARGTRLLAAAALLGATAGAAIAQNKEPTVAEPTNGNVIAGAKENFDVTYNVCRGTDPRCYHPWVDNRSNKVLIYTRTAGPRHANIGPAMAAGKNPPLTAAHVVQNSLIKWLADQGVTADWTEDVNQLSNLNTYKAVIFASNSRDALWKHGTAINPTRALDTTTGAHLDAGKTALRQYMRAGGGFVAIHNAFGTEYNWPWYEGLLGNANYYDHGANQAGNINIVAKSDSSTDGLPKVIPFQDEWYNLVPYPTNVKFLATVDENSLATKRTTHPGHGNFHPVAWCQYYDGGRAWMTTLGHDGRAFTDGSGFPGQAEFKQLLVNGILSAMGNKPFCQQ